MSHMSEASFVTERSMVVDAELENLAAIRVAIRDLCESVETTIEDSALAQGIAALELAVTELVSNVIRHGHEGIPGGQLQLLLSLASDGVFVLELTHYGRPFDGNTQDIAEITEPQEGGMGLYLISQCVDAIDYSMTPEAASHIRITKTF